MMNIKTYIATALVALTAACSQPEAPAPEIDATAAANNPADRDHSEARDAHTAPNQ